MSSKNNNKSARIQLLVFLGLGIGLIYWQYTAMSASDKQRMLDSIAEVNWWWLLPIVTVGFLSHLFRALRWKLLLAPLAIRPSTTNTVLAVLIGYLVNSLIPRAGEVAKCTVLAKYEAAPADKLIGTIVAERAFDLICLIIISCITLAIQYDVLYPYVQQLLWTLRQKMGTGTDGSLNWGRILLFLSLVVVLVIAFIFLYKKIRHSKAGNIIKGIGDGLTAIGKVHHKGRFLLYTLAIWACYTIILNMAFFAMPALTQVNPLASLSVVVFGSVAMIATPGGIGAYPPVVAGILLAYGIAFPEGNAFGWLSWMTQTGMVVSMGLIALLILPLYNRKQHEQQSIPHP